MKKLPRVSVHEVPPGAATDAELQAASEGGYDYSKWRHPPTPVTMRVRPLVYPALPPGVTPIYSAKLGPGEAEKRGPKRVRVRG